MRIALNVAVFYVGWFVAVWAAAKNWPVEATLASVAVVAIHMLVSQNRRHDWAVIVLAALAGIVVETIMVRSGLAIYKAAGPLDSFAPAWLVGMWMAFATMFNVSLNWMKHRLWLAVLFAAIGGPLSYYFGMKMGGMTMAEPLWATLGIIAVLWAVAFPLLLIYARQGDPQIGDVAVVKS
jgi:hypothetical protein